MAEQRQTKRSLSAEGAGVSGEDSDDGDGGAGHTDGAKRRRQDTADGNETNIAVSFEQQQQQGGGHAVAELEEKEDEAAPEGSVTAAVKLHAALFCTCTAAGDIAEWGACAADLTGVDAAGAVGRPMLELMVESDRVRARVADVLAGVVAGGGDVVDTYFFSFRRVVSRSRAIANASGDPGELGIVLAVHATPGPSGGGTALYVHEATYGLAQFRDLLRIIATANAIIVGIDAKNCVNEWNQQAVALTGFSREEAMGKPLVEEFIEPQAQDTVREVLNNALQGKQQKNYQLTLMTKDKVPLQVRVSIEGRGEAK